jgi:hypothetical protein
MPNPAFPPKSIEGGDVRLGDPGRVAMTSWRAEDVPDPVSGWSALQSGVA